MNFLNFQDPQSKVVQQLLNQLVYTCLLQLTKFHFTCGEKKIWQNIKNSQNIMTMVVVLFFSNI